MHVRVTGWGPGCHCASSLYLLKWVWCSSRTPTSPWVLWEVAAAGGDGGAGDGANSLHAWQNSATATSVCACPKGWGGVQGCQLLQKGRTGAAGGSGKCKSHWQTVSSFQAGALTWIVGSRKGGFQVLCFFRFEEGGGGFLSFFSFIFFLLFFFSFFSFSLSWPWLSLYLKAAKAEKLRLRNVGELKQSPSHWRLLCWSV